MDAKLKRYKDDRGNSVIDFQLGTTPESRDLPIRAGVWLLDEMSNPDRFSEDYANSTINIEDVGAWYASRSIIIFTDENRRNSFIDVVSGDEEVFQRAVVAATLQRGTIPSLPDTGNLWAELLVDETAAAEFNSTLQKNIQDLANTLSYKPNYEVRGSSLVVSIGD